MPSIFTRIIRGEIPSHRVYGDAFVVAFLDIAPLSRGHVLVVPIEEREFLHELSDESAAALGRALVSVARAVVQATGATAYNILQNNGAAAHQAIPHVHFHIIPKFEDGAPGGSGLGIEWESQQCVAADAALLAVAIRTRIEQYANP
ncbi:MAG: HIT family protein [Phycisphaerales bacterium]|nr:HIT family protein [Phycisphaerales bacterium]